MLEFENRDWGFKKGRKGGPDAAKAKVQNEINIEKLKGAEAELQAEKDNLAAIERRVMEVRDLVDQTEAMADAI